MILGVQRENYPDIKLIHIMLTDSLWSIIIVNNHWKDVILFSKTFLTKACHEVTFVAHTDMMDNDSRITKTVVYLYTYRSDNYLISVAW